MSIQEKIYIIWTTDEFSSTKLFIAHYFRMKFLAGGQPASSA
jgi:hypothetical protein